MASKVIMPKLSPTMEEGQIARWLKKEGDKVSMGEPLAEIDTDKATMEMQALANGVLRKILINEGESAPLGQLIAVIAEPNEDIAAILSEAPAIAETPVKAEAPAKAETPAAKQPEPRQPQPKEPEPKPAAEPAVATATNGRIIVSPVAARMAADSGLDLRSIHGSGPNGRIIKRDIEAALSQPKAAPAQARFQPAMVATASAYRDEPATQIRQTIAKRLVTSLGPVPHFFLTVDIEMDRAAEMRESIKALDPDLKISVNDVIIKCAAAALVQHPEVNASFQEKFIRYYEHADIGVAVAIEDGLITPVIRAADQKSLSQIASEVRELAERARSRKLKPEEYTGATFSISNLGMFGIDEFTAVINPPEGAILAIGTMTPKPVVRDNQVVVRQMMRVTMSCDHRVIDGATGSQFLRTVVRMLENPLGMVW
ncbi:MAG TPA: pyruvate dehydrogenase complex dihydrolipoamide acetyltransferase [Pyrinomonadaceae bacterium]|nr:pyruvate dehydrogenase complex dihydrolipoamide acetyltransferase [Pyrinomonadaceae bacterium]